MQEKYAEDSQEALEELVRRHMLPRVQEDDRIRGRLRGKDPEGDLMSLLVETAKLGRVPRDRLMELRRLERKYNNVRDERLLSQARRGGLGQRGTQMMRRLLRREQQNPPVHRTDQEQGTEEA